MVSDVLIIVYIASNIVMLIAALSCNRSLKKIINIQDLVLKDHQYQIDKIEMRVAHLEERNNFKWQVSKEDVEASPKKRIRRTKKELEFLKTAQ